LLQLVGFLAPDCGLEQEDWRLTFKKKSADTEQTPFGRKGRNVMWHGIELNFIGLLQNIGLISDEEAEKRVHALARKMGSAGWRTNGVFGDIAVPTPNRELNPQDDPMWVVNPANTADASNVANLIDGPLTRD
jgi:hypothetical protein